MEPTAFADSFVFGLASSLHCAGMCGPLGACFLDSGMGGSSAMGTATLYQGARIASYAAVGAVIGTLSATVGTAATGTPLAASTGVLSLVLGGLLALGALGVHRWIHGFVPGIHVGQSTFRRVWTWAMRRPVGQRALALGAVTPALPCGVLWVMYGTAAAAGTPVAGATAALGFGLGSAPLLWLAQSQLVHLQRWLGPRGLRRMQALAMAVAAAVLLWRGLRAVQAPGVSPCCGG